MAREEVKAFKLPEYVHRALKVYAAENGKTIKQVLVQIIIDFLAEEAKKKVAGGK